jgi:WD40 repeat protein
MAESGRDADTAGEAASERADLTVTSLRPSSAAPGTRSRGRFWYRVVGGCGLAALVLVGTLVWLHPALPLPAISPTPLPERDPLTVDAYSVGIPCVDGAAWSPDSRSFVLAGNSTCNGLNVAQDETLVVFNAHSGAVRAHTTVQVADIQRAIPPPGGASWAGTRIGYGQPFWSPDGRRIVLTFEADIPGAVATAGGPSNARDGIVVLDNTLSAMRIFGGLGRITPLLGVANFGPQTVEQWDLSAGSASAVTLPMGLAYSWSADDKLSASDVVAQTPDGPPPAGSEETVGNPIGGRDFTLWQNGNVAFADGTGCSGTLSATAPNYYLTFLSTSAWSPDGRYLALKVSANGRLPSTPPTPPTPAPSGSSGGCTNFGPPTQWPQMPVRDDGMRAAVALVDGTRLQSIQLAWSPDGRRIASQPSDIASGVPALTIYDCASGRLRLRLTAADLVPEQVGGQPFRAMAWSPDGTRLLLVPLGPFPIIHVLGPKSLGS